MAITVTQSGSSDSTTNATTHIITLGSNPASGALLVVVFNAGSGTATMSSVSGAGVGTWIKSNEQQNGATTASEWYGYVTGTPGTTVTGTWSAKINGNKSGQYVEIAGMATSSPLDVTGSATGAADPASTGSCTTTDAGDIAIGGYAANGAVDSDPTPGTGWTAITPVGQRGQSGYKIETSIETASASFTFGGTRTWSGVIAAYFPEATATFGYPFPRRDRRIVTLI